MSIAARPSRHVFTVEEYHRLDELGFFPPDARVELIDGEIVEMSAIGSRHNGCVNRLTRMLCAQVGDTAIVQVQGPARISDISELQPDVALLKFAEDFYSSGNPRPENTLLVIEVADTTFASDRVYKGRFYASAGISEYWIVDLTGSRILVLTDPEPGAYRSEQIAEGTDILVPRLVASVSVNVGEVLGTS